MNPGASTSRTMSALAVEVPEVAVTVTRYDPRTAEVFVVSVNTLAPVVAFGSNDAVTPLGKGDVTARLTVPVKPAWSFTVTVVVLELPGLMLNVVGEAER